MCWFYFCSCCPAEHCVFLIQSEFVTWWKLLSKGQKALPAVVCSDGECLHWTSGKHLEVIRGEWAQLEHQLLLLMIWRKHCHRTANTHIFNLVRLTQMSNISSDIVSVHQKKSAVEVTSDEWNRSAWFSTPHECATADDSVLEDAMRRSQKKFYHMQNSHLCSKQKETYAIHYIWNNDEGVLLGWRLTDAI